MSRSKKIVQNYEILETLQQYQNEYSILLASNITDRKLYTLKKLSIKNGNNQLLYSVLLGEANLLKMFKHDSIVTCYRMLKTSSSLYIAYSYLEGNTLQEVLELGPKALTFSQKEMLAKELCLAIAELHKSSVAHLNIHPANIKVGKKMKIMLNEFIYAMQIPEQGEIDVKRKIPKSQFVAPEVKRGIACLEGDIYSYGKILEKLQFRKSKKESSTTDNNKKIEEFESMIESMIAKERHRRLSLNEVYKCLFSKLKKIQRMRSLSQNNLGFSQISNNTSLSVRNSQFGSKKLYNEILMKLMRQRNMSWFLVKLFRSITIFIRFNSELTVILGILLLKKSTKLLANLGKYLHYGKNDIQVDIAIKDQSKFFKTQDYFKMMQLIDKQIVVQRKEFEAAADVIFSNNAALLKKGDFYKEMKEEQVNHQYLSECIQNYVREIFNRQTFLNGLKTEYLVDLYFLSSIAADKSFQDFFRTNFTLEEILLDQHPFMKKTKEMSREQLMQSIMKGMVKKVEVKMKRAPTLLQMMQI